MTESVKINNDYILDYISDKQETSTEDIAKHFDTNTDFILNRLKNMLRAGIVSLSYKGNKNDPKRHWQVTNFGSKQNI